MQETDIQARWASELAMRESLEEHVTWLESQLESKQREAEGMTAAMEGLRADMRVTKRQLKLAEWEVAELQSRQAKPRPHTHEGGPAMVSTEKESRGMQEPDRSDSTPAPPRRRRTRNGEAILEGSGSGDSSGASGGGGEAGQGGASGIDRGKAVLMAIIGATH